MPIDGTCKDYPHDTCKKVKKERLKQISYKDCVTVPKQVCKNVPALKCRMVIKQFCSQVSYPHCRQVPEQECHLVHKKVPKRVSKRVAKKICNVGVTDEIMGRSAD